MKNLTTATILGLSLLATLASGCNGKGDESGNEESTIGDSLPQLTEWEMVVDKLPFPTSGDAKINRLTIGRKEYMNNFANRGDIEVLFDQDSDVISIEMRKYDFSDDITAKGDEATGKEGTFERMSLWAFNEGGSNPAQPTMADLEDVTKNCQLEAWKDGCSVFVYYDGLTQPVRSGADLRVHLPKAWRGELNVQTEDNEGETTYPRRSNVTIGGPGDAGWCSSGSVKMSAGVGKIKLCRDLSVAPACTAAQIEACENFEKDGMPAAWDPTCGCNAMNFGQIRIESLKPWAADITVDMPDDVWLNATVANQSDAKPHECKPVLENCTDGKCVKKTDDEYTQAGEFNYPSPAAPSGAGFNLTVLSAGCTLVDYFATPDDWAADATPDSEIRGHLKVCTGCLE